MQKAIYKDTAKPIDLVNVMEEVGDAYWYMALLYKELNLDFSIDKGLKYPPSTNKKTNLDDITTSKN